MLGRHSVLPFQSIVSFGMQGLLWQTAAQVNPANLVHSDWTAVPKTLPVLSLAFVYQNVVPIICSSLEVSLPSVQCPGDCLGHDEAAKVFISNLIAWYMT